MPPIPKKHRTPVGIIALLALMILATVGCTENTSGRRVSIKILHINDIHSFLTPDTVELHIDETAVTAEIGGMARVAGLIRSLTEDGGNHLVLHAGDAVPGSLYFTLFDGRADAEVMNAIDFDALTIGNHEFDKGNMWLANFIQRLNSPVISANIGVPPGDALGKMFSPFIIREFDGIPIGIIGLTPGEVTRRSSRPDSGTEFTDEVRAVQNAVDDLRARGIARIVLLSHCGFETDLALAPRVTDLDVIVGGHSHTLLGDFESYGLQSAGPYPTIAWNADGDPVCVVQAWEHGYVLGELDVVFEGDRITSWNGIPHLVLGETFIQKTKGGETYTLACAPLSRIIAAAESDPKLDMPPEDTAVAAAISTYATKVQAYRQTVIGTAGEDLRHIRLPGTKTNGTPLPLGSDIAPLVAKAFYERIPHADVCIQNAGGIRTGIDAGDISYSTVCEMLPFSNTLFEIEMTGAQIHQVLEDALEYIAETGTAGAFPYAYALRYDVDATQSYGDRVRNLEVKNRNSGIYSPIGENIRYVVVASDYLAEGRDGYDTFAEVLKQGARGVDTDLDDTRVFFRYLKERTKTGAPLKKLAAEDHCIKSFTPPLFCTALP